MIIGVMGPEGSYSEKAAKLWTAKYYLCGAEFRYFADIEDTLLAAVQGKSDLSVIPVENSIEGSVGITLDLLLEKDVRMVGEVVVKIEHCLLAKGRLEEIRIILSHPQGLAQCRHFLKKHFPGTELRSTGSTSHAARLAGEFEEMAAIASPEAAECYKLKTLLSNIQDQKENYTRFIVLKAGEKNPKAGETDQVWQAPFSAEATMELTSCPESEYDPGIMQENLISTCKNFPFKTSLIIYLEKDRPGALYEILGAFAKRKINLTKIESRPSKKELGDYYFYIDFDGHASDALIKDALKDIIIKVDTLKVLGSYPACKSEQKY
jgi:prephenate dehydratase